MVSSHYSPKTMASICVAFFSLCCDIFLLLMGLVTLERVLPLDRPCVWKSLATAGIWPSLEWPFFSSQLGCHSSCRGGARLWPAITEPAAEGGSFDFSGGLGLAVRPTSTLLSCCITSFITSCKMSAQIIIISEACLPGWRAFFGWRVTRGIIEHASNWPLAICYAGRFWISWLSWKLACSPDDRKVLIYVIFYLTYLLSDVNHNTVLAFPLCQNFSIL